MWDSEFWSQYNFVFVQSRRSNYISVFPGNKVGGKTESKRFLIKLIICNDHIWKGPINTSTTKPPTKIYECKWLEAMARHKHNPLQTKIMHLKAIERGKTFLTGAPHKTDLTSITQQCFIILGREGPSLIFVFYTGSWQIRYSAFEKYKTAGWDKIHTKRTAAVPGWRRMLLWIRLQISDWTFRFKNVRTGQSTKNWHTHIDLPYLPSNSQLTNLFSISHWTL